jgi:hypothetical protein
VAKLKMVTVRQGGYGVPPLYVKVKVTDPDENELGVPDELKT